MFFVAVDLFNKVSRCFLSVLGHELVEMSFWIKNKRPYFSGHHIQGMNKWHVVCWCRRCVIFFPNAWGIRYLTRPIKFQKIYIGMRTRRCLIGPGSRSGLPGPAAPNLILLKKIIFKKNNALVDIFFK
jgi:hypothetical protein